MHNFRNMQRGKVRLKLKAVVGQGCFFHWYWQWWWCSCCFLVDAMIWMMFHLRGWWLIMVGKLLRRALISTGEWETILCNTLIVLFSYLLSASKYSKQSLSWLQPPHPEKNHFVKKETFWTNYKHIALLGIPYSLISYRVIADCAKIQSILNGGPDLSNPPRI